MKRPAKPNPSRPKNESKARPINVVPPALGIINVPLAQAVLNIDAIDTCLYNKYMDGWLQLSPLPSGQSAPTVNYTVQNISGSPISGRVAGYLDNGLLLRSVHSDPQITNLLPGATTSGSFWFYGASPGAHRMRLVFLAGDGQSGIAFNPATGQLQPNAGSTVLASTEQPYLAGDLGMLEAGLMSALGITATYDQAGNLVEAHGVDPIDGIKRSVAVTSATINDVRYITRSETVDASEVTTTLAFSEDDGKQHRYVPNSGGNWLSIAASVKFSVAQYFQPRVKLSVLGYPNGPDSAERAQLDFEVYPNPPYLLDLAVSSQNLQVSGLLSLWGADGATANNFGQGVSGIFTWPTNGTVSQGTFTGSLLPMQAYFPNEFDRFASLAPVTHTPLGVPQNASGNRLTASSPQPGPSKANVPIDLGVVHAAMRTKKAAATLRKNKSNNQSLVLEDQPVKVQDWVKVTLLTGWAVLVRIGCKGFYEWPWGTAICVGTTAFAIQQGLAFAEALKNPPPAPRDGSPRDFGPPYPMPSPGPAPQPSPGAGPPPAMGDPCADCPPDSMCFFGQCFPDPMGGGGVDTGD